MQVIIINYSYKSKVLYRYTNQSLFLVTHLETQLDSKNGRRIAVCKATYKNKTPTLRWEPALNFSSNATVKKFDTFVIMEIRAPLPDYMTISNVTCVASYPSVSGSLQQNSTLDLTTQGEFYTHCISKGIDTCSATSTFTVHSAFTPLNTVYISCCSLMLKCFKRKHFNINRKHHKYNTT